MTSTWVARRFPTLGGEMSEAGDVLGSLVEAFKESGCVVQI